MKKLYELIAFGVIGLSLFLSLGMVAIAQTEPGSLPARSPDSQSTEELAQSIIYLDRKIKEIREKRRKIVSDQAKLNRLTKRLQKTTALLLNVWDAAEDELGHCENEKALLTDDISSPKPPSRRNIEDRRVFLEECFASAQENIPSINQVEEEVGKLEDDIKDMADQEDRNLRYATMYDKQERTRVESKKALEEIVRDRLQE